MRLKEENTHPVYRVMGTTKHTLTMTTPSRSLHLYLDTSKTPVAPRDTSEWYPSDEIFFIKSMVMPYRDSKSKDKLYPSIADQLKVSPQKLLYGYLNGIDKREDWGKKITPAHVLKFKTLAYALLTELES